jgi:ubiquinone/menaquinone biosynthesis C-methylase UbiE
MSYDANVYKQKTRAGFNRQAAQYDFSAHGEHARTLYGHALKKLSLFPHRSVVDIGCGTGAVLSLISQQSRSVLTLAGIDLSPEMIRVAKSKLASRADLRVGDAEELPWPDHSFNIVLCLDSFHHYPHPQKALFEMKRVAQRHGTLILGDGWWPSPIR